MKIRKLTCASWIGIASVFALGAQGQNTVVTNNWNVTPWNVGHALETFESLPSWVPATEASSTSGSWVTRADRFWKTEYPPNNQLVFATLGITNTISGALIKAGLPIFIDMRCKMTPFDTTPPAIESNTLLCFYVNEKSNLVVASSSQCITNSATVNPAIYYPIMIRFASDTFDVFFDNAATPISLLATTNVISKLILSGAGEMDDLYISYGDPLRTVTNSVVQSGGDWSATPDASEQIVRNWLANKAATGTFTKANADKFFLIDAAPTSPTFAAEMGIGSFSYNPSTSNMTVVVTLKTDATSKKTGKINGKLQLKGAGDYNAAKSGGWSSTLGTTTMQTNDFVNGSATYTFKLIGDANTNKFFLPIIVSQ